MEGTCGRRDVGRKGGHELSRVGLPARVFGPSKAFVDALGGPVAGGHDEVQVGVSLGLYGGGAGEEEAPAEALTLGAGGDHDVEDKGVIELTEGVLGQEDRAVGGLGGADEA